MRFFFLVRKDILSQNLEKSDCNSMYFHFSIIQFELKIFVRSLIRSWKTSSLLDFRGYAVALDEKMVSSQWYRWGVAVSNERESMY